MIMTATEILNRQKEHNAKLAALYESDPIGFILAAQGMINRQWAADASRYKVIHNETSDGEPK